MNKQSRAGERHVLLGPAFLRFEIKKKRKLTFEFDDKFSHNRLAFSRCAAYNIDKSRHRGALDMTHTANVLNSLVPISQFNRGQASRIFDRLHTESQLVVLKNNAPAAVILSPEEYTRLTEMEEDYRLLMLAQERLASADPKKLRSMETVMEDLGITQEEIDAAEDVEIE